CFGCELKNKTLKNLRCYFLVDKQFIHNLQIDCKLQIYADINDISNALQYLIPPIKPTIPNKLLPRPLSAFDKPPIEKWESLVSSNFKKKTISINIMINKNNKTLDNKIVASCTIQHCGLTISIFNKYWPSKINSLLTLLIFILTTTDNTATLKITTNNIPFKNLVEHTMDIHHISHLKLDRSHFPYLQRLLMAMLMERKIEISHNPDLKISDPSSPYPLDTIPQDFLYNRFSTLINDIPTIYPIKILLKRIHQITNDISWHNQQRIQLWESHLKDIDWDITLETLIFNDKPKALYTNPTLSNIKNFKIKLIAEELPT